PHLDEERVVVEREDLKPAQDSAAHQPPPQLAKAQLTDVAASRRLASRLRSRTRHGFAAAPSPSRNEAIAGGRRSAREIGLNLVAHHSYLVGLEIARNGRAQTLPGLDLESSGMKRTFDHLAIEPAVGEHGEGVRTDIVGGVNRAVEVIERDRLALRLDAQHV